MDTNGTFLLRWRGRQQGPYSFAQIERKLADSELGMLHEIQINGEWVTLKHFIGQVEADRRAEAERLAAAGQAVAAGLAPKYPKDEWSKEDEAEAGDDGGADAVSLGVGDCIKRAWQLTTKNPVESVVGWLIFAFVLGIMWVLYFGVWSWAETSRILSLDSHDVLVYALSIICMVTIWLLYNLVGGAMWGGYWYLLVRVIRREPAGLGDLFVGFKRKWLQLAIGLFISNLFLSVVFLLPLVIYAEILAIFFLTTVSAASLSNVMGQTSGFFTGLFFWVGLVLACVASLGLSLYVFATRLLFAMPLIIDRQIGFFNAMKMSRQQVSGQFGGVFGLILLSAMISLSGFLLCGLGEIFTAPLAFMALAVAYVEIFDSAETDQADDGPHLFRWILGIALAVCLLLGLALAIVAFAKFGPGSKGHGAPAAHASVSTAASNISTVAQAPGMGSAGAGSQPDKAVSGAVGRPEAEAKQNGFTIVTSQIIESFPERVVGHKVAILQATYHEMTTTYLDNVPGITLEDNGLTSTINVDAKRNLVGFWAEDRDGKSFHKFVGDKGKIGEELLDLKDGEVVNIYGKGFVLERSGGDAGIWVETMQTVNGTK